MNHCLLKGMSPEQIWDMDNPAAYFTIIPQYFVSTGYEQGVNTTVISQTCPQNMPLPVFDWSLYNKWKFHHCYHRDPTNWSWLNQELDEFIYNKWDYCFDNSRDPISHDSHYNQQFIGWLQTWHYPPLYVDYLHWNKWYFNKNAHKQ